MTDTVGQDSGIKVELDVKRLSELISRRVAEQLTGLFPAEAAEFCRVVVPVDLVQVPGELRSRRGAR